MNLDEIRKQAQRFLAGEAEAETLLNALDEWRTAQWPGGTVDLDRQRRCGFPEVIFAAGKTRDELCAAIQRSLDADLPVLATRVTEQQADAAGLEYDRRAKVLSFRRGPPRNLAAG